VRQVSCELSYIRILYFTFTYAHTKASTVRPYGNNRFGTFSLNWHSILPNTSLRTGHGGSRRPTTVVKVDRRITWHSTATILRLRIGARLTRYRNCKFHNFARTISRHADGINRYSVPPNAGPLLPLPYDTHHLQPSTVEEGPIDRTWNDES